MVSGPDALDIAAEISNRTPLTLDEITKPSKPEKPAALIAWSATAGAVHGRLG